MTRTMDSIGMTMTEITMEHIRQSNLIEGVNHKTQDQASMEAFEELLNLDVTETSIKNLHWNVMRSLMKDPGKWRDCWVEVGGRTCPNPLYVPQLMKDWIEDCQELSPRVAHISFERIHPFRDGNGRVGRMLMWCHEIKNGIEPTLIHYDDRWSYYSWF